MRRTSKPFVTKAEVAPKAMIRCVNCTNLSLSPYLLNGEKLICEECVRTYDIVKISDRNRAVLNLISEGFSNSEIQSKLGLTRNAISCIVDRLVQWGLVKGRGVRRMIWVDPNTGIEHPVTRKELQIIEAALDPSLQYAYDYCQTIADRTQTHVGNLYSILYRLRQRGIPIPDRGDRFEAWKPVLKKQVLIEGKAPKSVSRQAKRHHSTPAKTLNSMGIRLNRQNLAQKIYLWLLPGMCPKKALYQEFHRQGFSRGGIENAIYTLKRLGVIALTPQAIFIIKKVDLCQIRFCRRSRKKTLPTLQNAELAKPLSSASSTMPSGEERA